MPLHGVIGGSFDDRVLRLARQVDELGAVAGDPDQHVPIVFGIFLRFAQCFGGNHVELDMESAQGKVGPNQRRQIFRLRSLCSSSGANFTFINVPPEWMS